MQTRRITWVDAQGLTSSTQINGSGSLASLQASLLLVSNADYVREFEGTNTPNGSPSPTAATYESVTDQAALWFTTAAGVIVQVTLPAPHSTIFMADQMTVNPAAITAQITAALAVVTDTSGNAVTAFVAGLRQNRS